MQAYCMKCRAKREMKDAKAITMKNGKPATQGRCPVCGTKMFRIGKSQDQYHSYQDYSGWRSLGVDIQPILLSSPPCTVDYGTTKKLLSSYTIRMHIRGRIVHFASRGSWLYGRASAKYSPPFVHPSLKLSNPFGFTYQFCQLILTKGIRTVSKKFIVIISAK